MTLHNGPLAAVVANLTSADFTLDMDGRDRSFKKCKANKMCWAYIFRMDSIEQYRIYRIYI